VRITVIESPAARPEIREAVRAALEDLPHEVDYTTDGGTNPLERLMERDAFVLIDSNLDLDHAAIFGWALRGLPALIIIDRAASPLYSVMPPDGPFHLVPTGASAFEEELRSFLADGITAIADDPTEFTSSYVLSRQPSSSEQDAVFISYSHRDSAHLDRLLVHLEPLKREGAIKLWSDQQIRPGAKWRDEIALAIEKAGVAILLVSPDFLASEFISTDELPPLLRAARERGAVILPIILRPCRFTRDPQLSAFQAFNKAKPVALLSDVEQDQIWDDVAAEVERRVNDGPIA
jgi:hypothetical protein